MQLVSPQLCSSVLWYCLSDRVCALFWQLLEFRKVAFATGVGFLLMGFIGFFVKLVHIPINQVRHARR